MGVSSAESCGEIDPLPVCLRRIRVFPNSAIFNFAEVGNIRLRLADLPLSGGGFSRRIDPAFC